MTVLNSYETPHRIHDIAIYPTPSPNGSSIIVYGHENGVRVIWRGGKHLKLPHNSEDKAKTNGDNNIDVMIIDSDDEGPGSNAPLFEDSLEFENGDEEIDASKLYPDIVQHFDLNFGAAALHIAVPPISSSAVDTASGLCPAMMNEQLIFVVACSDQRLRLITRPLSPPSPISKSRKDIRSTITASYAGNGKWGETVLELAGSPLPADGLSLTFVKADKISIASGGTNLRKTRSTSTSRPAEDDWHILVASHSREGPGLLLIHRIPIITSRKDGKACYSLSRAHAGPSQRISLSAQATTLNFNPNISSPSQSTHLLVADKKGACRIYDCEPSHISVSVSSESLGSTNLGPQAGSWLLTMYPGFLGSKSDAPNTISGTSVGNLSRKAVVDAKWAMGGKAIIVLLSDGEWGIWDVEGGPASGGSKGILRQQSIKGGAITAFSVSGWIDSPPVKSSSGKGASTRTSTSKFAPMTPSTRKTAEPVLFGGRSGHRFARGKISVVRLPAMSTTSQAEECITFWLEDSYCVIPNLRAYWDAQSRRSTGGSGTLFGGGSPTSRMVRLEGVNLRGERCCGVDQCSRGATSKSLLPTEILILGEHRYIIASDNSHQPLGPKQRAPASTEYQLMASRDLDVTEIDQVLSRMENGNFSTPIKQIASFLD